MPIPLIDDKCEVWTASHDSSRYDTPTAQVVGRDGKRVYMTGMTVGEDTEFECLTTAVDQNDGKTVWTAIETRAANGLGTKYAWCFDIAVDTQEESVYVTGIAGTYAYDAATGERRWGRPRSSTTAGSMVDISPDGSIVYISGHEAYYNLVALDARDGALLWQGRYEPLKPGRLHEPSAMRISPSGDAVYLTGVTKGVGGQWDDDFGTVAFDALSGERKWVSRYSGPARLSTDWAWSLAVSPDGSMVYVNGGSETAASEDPFGNRHLQIATIAYDSRTGEEKWATRYDPVGGNHVLSGDSSGLVVVSPSGDRVFVVGTAETIHKWQPDDAVAIAYDAITGDREWVQTYDFGFDDAFYSGVVSPDGSTLYVGGRSEPPNWYLSNYDWSLGNETSVRLAYDTATGQQKWVARCCGHTPGTYDAGSQVPLSPNGDSLMGLAPKGNRLFVGGWNLKVPLDGFSDNFDLALWAYDV